MTEQLRVQVILGCEQNWSIKETHREKWNCVS